MRSDARAVFHPGNLFHADAAASKDTRRLVAAAAMTVSAAFLGTFAMLAAERMSIHKVSAPRLDDLSVFAPSVVEAPKPPEPPKVEAKVAAGGGAAASQDRAEAEDRDDLFERSPRNEANPKPTSGPPGGPNLPGHVPGVGRSPIPGTGTCTGPQCDAGWRKVPRKPKAPVHVSRQQLACIACPDPKRDELRMRAAPGFRSGTQVTSFCVDERGKVEKVTMKRSSGDRGVDAACLAAVRRWRLKPFKVGGVPQRACTQVSFDVAMK